MFIEAQGKKILFDTGASTLFADSADALGVDLAAVDFCMISHGHYDHTSGLPEFCRRNSHAPVYIHQDAFSTFYGTTDGEIDDYNCGITIPESELNEIRDRFILTGSEPLWLTDNMVISGTIPEAPGFKPAEQFYKLMPDGSLAKDTMSHEQFLAIREKDGIYLFSGCSHMGIVSAMEYARTLFPGEPFAGIIAGMHLFGASNEMRAQVIEKIAEADPRLVVPVHCTGLAAEVMMKMKFGNRCILGACGCHYQFGE